MGNSNKKNEKNDKKNNSVQSSNQYFENLTVDKDSILNKHHVTPELKIVDTSLENVNYLKSAINETNNSNLSEESNSEYLDTRVKKYVDYSSKYGLGYLLYNGFYGVTFNDKSKIVLNPNTNYFFYIEGIKANNQETIISYNMNEYPNNLNKKVTLLKHFKNYLEEDKSNNINNIKEEKMEKKDKKLIIKKENKKEFDEKNIIYVKKWLKTKHAILFRLSNKIVQVNFMDKTEVILSIEKKNVTYVNKKGENSTYPLETAMESSNPQLTKRLKYTKDILTYLLQKNKEKLNQENKPSSKVLKKTYSTTDFTRNIKDLQINSNDNNDNKINNNINNIINIENNNQNDINENLNIGNNINKGINIYKEDNNNIEMEQKEKNILKKRITLTNISGNILTEPNYCIIFDDINILNSILIMLNNISLVNKYFLKETGKNKIKMADQYFQYSLISLIYYINKSLWNYEKTSIISENDLLEKYKDFYNIFIQKYCLDSNPDKFYYNIENVEKILNYLYEKINIELTFAKTGVVTKNYENNKTDDLTEFFNDFKAKNQSFISDNFIGTYQYNLFCLDCQKKNINYCEKSWYKSFFSIDFNLDEIKTFYLNNNFYFNSFKLNDFFNCFKKIRTFKSECKICKKETQKNEIRFLLALPNILTITLSNNDNNDLDFILEDEIITKIYGSVCPYIIISFLCIVNGNFICYCINPNNGLWYCYENKKITKVEKYDIDIKPLVLIYQNKNSILFQYNYIKKDDSKIPIIIRFQSGIRNPTKLYFKKNIRIKKVVEQIKLHFSLENIELFLLINGKKANDDDLLNGNYEYVTVITK